MKRLMRAVDSRMAVVLLIVAVGWSWPAAPAAAFPLIPRGMVAPGVAAIGVAPALSPPGCTLTHDTFLKDDDRLIPEAVNSSTPGVITSTLTVSGLGVSMWDVNIQAYISHTHSSDLSFFLISPHGTSVTLSSQNGGLNQNVFYGTVWDDQAGLTPPAGPVTLANFSNHVVKTNLMPEEPLSAFNGENPNGDWKLVVKDSVTGGFTGELNGWGLDISALNQAPAYQEQIVGGGNAAAIPDGGVVTSSLTLPAFLVPLTGLTLTTYISHSRPGDLLIDLITPSGLTLTVSSRNGGTSAQAFNGTVWYDGAGRQNPPGPVTDQFFFGGGLVSPLAPQESFAEFSGHDGSGKWTLRVADQVVNGQSGTLDGMQLIAVEAHCYPNLTFETSFGPVYPRLGQTAFVDSDFTNSGVAAHHVLLTDTVTGGFAFEGDYHPELACTEPTLLLVDPLIKCSMASLTNQNPQLRITLTAPLTPIASPFTLTVTSDRPDLFSGDNTGTVQAVAFAHSANGNPWDIADAATLGYGQDLDDGAIETGGQGAFTSFGLLKLRVLSLADTLIDADDIHNLGLTYAPGGHWHTTQPENVGGVLASREIFAPAGADWVRYVDTFTNSGFTDRHLVVGWGGGMGLSSYLTPTATSTHDLAFTSADTWAALASVNNLGNASLRPPLGLVFRSPTDATYQGPYVFIGEPFTSTVWPSADINTVGQVFRFTLPAGSTLRTAYFVYRGLTESALGPADCNFYGGCVTPAAGSQQALAASTAAALAANPPFCDLSVADRLTLINWPNVTMHCVYLPLAIR